MRPNLRYLTRQEMDQLGFSDPDSCHICASGGHQCGGCGESVEHQLGSTCRNCRKLFYEALYGPSD